ncbi:MAG: NAD-dependent epimerase/dehydratase family protein [Bacteroidia bacterium]|nr:NAD-dependent epimerase/dehydratase family protein [Bacteroidia bacterium]NNJ54960.1 NAD-dependent epimerase/dehydratase family protein [Bacteroidia bacterium]
MIKKVAVLGGGGFIGNHLVAKLKSMQNYVVAVDLVRNEYSESAADEFHIKDLRDQNFVNEFFTTNTFDEVYQLAADMGGAGFIFTGDNDANIMHNSVQINLNVAEALKNSNTKIFYSSSACIYPEENQMDPQNPNCAEASAFPANPDSEYGWEKLFSERLYLSYARNYGLDVRIARFHNIYGPNGCYTGGREKAPAAICRKVAMAKDSDSIEVWGSGNQTRSFLYVDECIDGVLRLMESNHKQPVNIGSDEMVTINQLTEMVIAISGKNLTIKNIDGPVGVNGRCSDNQVISKVLNWKPDYPLKKGMIHLYNWVNSQV